MKAEYPFQKSPRCTAMSKRTKQRCGAPAERGKHVCRFHGARAGAPSGTANGQYKHGQYSQEAIQVRRSISALLSASRKQIALVEAPSKSAGTSGA
jgi:hypothetical protein